MIYDVYMEMFHEIYENLYRIIYVMSGHLVCIYIYVIIYIFLHPTKTVFNQVENGDAYLAVCRISILYIYI